MLDFYEPEHPAKRWKTLLPWTYDDGGRAAAGFPKHNDLGVGAGDCVTRAVAIATGLPYTTVHTELRDALEAFWTVYGGDVPTFRLNPDHGVPVSASNSYYRHHGFVEVAPSSRRAMLTTRFVPDAPVVVADVQLPEGLHTCAIVDGVLRDLGDFALTAKVRSFWVRAVDL